MKRFALQDKRQSNYFEGWYVRVIDVNQSINMAFIFAKTVYKKDPHAFLQIFDAVAGTNQYVRYPIETFSFEEDCVRISTNLLSLTKIKIVYKSLYVDLTLSDLETLGNQSAMGPLKALPLECYQEVIFMNARVQGTFRHGSKRLRIDHGQSYMEKTYGRKFPERWFWLQANQFGDGAALSFAGGKVPTLFFKKFGFFLIFQYQSHTCLFATYNLARLRMKQTAPGQVRFQLKKGRYRLEIEATQRNPVILVGPRKYGEMTLDVPESLDSTVALKLYARKKLIYEGVSERAGFEWMFVKQ